MEDEIKCDSQEIKNYVMYKIFPKNTELNLCYVGHTTDFNSRKYQHKLACINETHTKMHLKIYQKIRENGGWKEWEMIKLEQFNGKTNLEARMREQELIKQHNANLNSLSAFVTEEQRVSTKKAITEKYREENKELLKEQTKKYKEDHKDIIAEQMKKYREENKEKLKEQTKAYREQNKEKCRELQKEWVSKNKDILKEKRKIKTAEQKQQKILEKEQNVEIETDEQKAENEKNKLEKAKKKREQYNENRRLQRLKDKEKINKD
jgi:hypothetical protein